MGALADGAQFGEDEPLVLQADALQVGPQTLLDIEGTAVESGGEVGVLGMHHVLEAALDEVGAELGGGLQVRQGAQELHFLVE